MTNEEKHTTGHSMIKLPKNWEDGIQVRDWMQPINELSDVAILLLYIKNKHNQSYGFALPIRVSQLEITLNAKLKEELHHRALDDGRKAIISKIKKETSRIKRVYVPKDQDWAILKLPGTYMLARKKK